MLSEACGFLLQCAGGQPGEARLLGARSGRAPSCLGSGTWALFPSNNSIEGNCNNSNINLAFIGCRGLY